VSRYRNAWVTATAATAAVGVVVAVLTWAVSGALGVFAGSAVMGGGMTAALQPESTPRPGRRALVGALATGVVVVGGCGLLVLLGPAAVLLMAALAVSAPAVLTRARGWLDRFTPGPADDRPDSPPGTPATWDASADGDRAAGDAAVTGSAAVPAEPSTSPAPETLDDSELCWAWRRSYVALQQSRSSATRLRIVQARQAYLDELERRNAAGLSAWLDSGARAAGDPTRFILHRSPTGPPHTE
jgi:hypothetical protein